MLKSCSDQTTRSNMEVALCWLSPRGKHNFDSDCSALTNSAHCSSPRFIPQHHRCVFTPQQVKEVLYLIRCSLVVAFNLSYLQRRCDVTAAIAVNTVLFCLFAQNLLTLWQLPARFIRLILGVLSKTSGLFPNHEFSFQIAILIIFMVAFFQINRFIFNMSRCHADQTRSH